MNSRVRLSINILAKQWKFLCTTQGMTTATHAQLHNSDNTLACYRLLCYNVRTCKEQFEHTYYVHTI